MSNAPDVQGGMGSFVQAGAGAMSSGRTLGIVPISWFYRHGHATALGKVFSRFWASWASLGLPPRRQLGLEVKGRRTGRPHTLAVVVVTHEGDQYLVSMLGECEWVKNVRAQGEAFIISDRWRKVRLEEVPVERRAPIIIHPSRAWCEAAHWPRHDGSRGGLRAGGTKSPSLSNPISERARAPPRAVRTLPLDVRSLPHAEAADPCLQSAVETLLRG